MAITFWTRAEKEKNVSKASVISHRNVKDREEKWINKKKKTLKPDKILLLVFWRFPTILTEYSCLRPFDRSFSLLTSATKWMRNHCLHTNPNYLCLLLQFIIKHLLKHFPYFYQVFKNRSQITPPPSFKNSRIYMDPAEPTFVARVDQSGRRIDFMISVLRDSNGCLVYYQYKPSSWVLALLVTFALLVSQRKWTWAEHC